MSDKEIIYDEYCVGKCPKCMSENIEYYPPEEDGDLLSYSSQCKDCGLQFYEYYHVKYKHSYGIEFPTT
jgi:predicted Zn-ribbon and HTH transcriptional regulator